MKKHILLVAAAISLTSSIAVAQNFDNESLVQYSKNDFSVEAGGRFMIDAAYYNTEYTPMKSGASITDARLRTLFQYKKWDFYIDVDFSSGEVKQKNIFLQYATQNKSNGTHAIKVGYYNDPASMSNNTSMGSYHFISRPMAVKTLAPTRELGISYKFYNDKFFANQGIFTENKYNDQEAGSQGITLGGRWLYRPINNSSSTLHLGVSARFQKIATGTLTNDVIYTELHLSSDMQTYVDPTSEFINASIAWASEVYDFSAEALFKTDRFFARGEYLYKYVNKKRDDYTLFMNQLGSAYSWGSLASWQSGNPLRSNTFQSAYIETGFLIFGDKYSYSNEHGTLGGLKGRSLEVVARYSYTDLNDIVEGEKYVLGRDQYYPNGVLADYATTSTSVGGGRVHSATVGINYSFNSYIQIMADYTYHNLYRDKYQYDQNFNQIQVRLMVNF